MIFISMWKKDQSKEKFTTEDERKVKNINVWSFFLLLFVVVWMAGSYIYLNRRADVSIPPVIILDEAQKIGLTNSHFPPKNPTAAKSSFEIRETYNVGDTVIVSYFYVEGIVVKKSALGDEYTIMYENHNHTLELITLPRTFLMAPSTSH